MDAAQLAPRRLPAQQRGHAAFERILDAAARLIEQGGIERLNTNLVAAESSTNISTVYKFFPNKLAILATLFTRYNNERTASTFELLNELETAADWRRVIEQAIDRNSADRRRQRGGAALRRAMRSSPELIVLEQASSAAAAEALARLVRKRGGLSAAKARVVARFIIELEVTMLDWWESPEIDHAPAILRELKLLTTNYLASYLDPPP